MLEESSKKELVTKQNNFLLFPPPLCQRVRQMPVFECIQNVWVQMVVVGDSPNSLEGVPGVIFLSIIPFSRRSHSKALSREIGSVGPELTTLFQA